MRQRRLPFTAGDRQDPPERVRAPQRVLESIGTTLRVWALLMKASDVFLEPAVRRAVPHLAQLWERVHPA